MTKRTTITYTLPAEAYPFTVGLYELDADPALATPVWSVRVEAPGETVEFPSFGRDLRVVATYADGLTAMDPPSGTGYP
jgi:hypothetical protein